VRGRRSLAASGGHDLHTLDAGEELTDAGMAPEVVLVKPQVVGLARPAVDQIGVHLPRPSGCQQDAAGAVPGKIQDVGECGVEKVVELPEEPTPAVAAGD